MYAYIHTLCSDNDQKKQIIKHLRTTNIYVNYSLSLCWCACVCISDLVGNICCVGHEVQAEYSTFLLSVQFS